MDRMTAATDLDETITELLIARARSALENAWAPYSGFAVGAAVAAGGAVYVGCNVENAAYPLSVCAERNAIAAAVVAGVTTMDALAVVTATEEPTPPCGACRQVMLELGDFPVIMATLANERRQVERVRDLLPHPFAGGHLKVPH
jgi:cytidine deaminase